MFPLCALLVVAVTGCTHFPFRSSPSVPGPGPADPALAVPAPVVVRGTVTYLQRAVLPPSAVVEVRLRDRTGGEGEGLPVAETTVRRPGQVPVAFELAVPASLFDADHDYALSARILVDELVLFASDAEVPVLTHGHPRDAQLVVNPPAAP